MQATGTADLKTCASRRVENLGIGALPTKDGARENRILAPPIQQAARLEPPTTADRCGGSETKIVWVWNMLAPRPHARRTPTPPAPAALGA